MQIRKLIQAATILYLLISTPVSASTNSGAVTNVIVGGNIAYITIAGGNYATCASNHRYVVDLTSSTGRAMYAMALASKLAGSILGIIGSGSCTLMQGTDAEDVLNTIL